MKILSILGPVVLLASFVQVAHADDGGGGSDNNSGAASSSSNANDSGAAHNGDDSSFDKAPVMQFQPLSTTNSVEP
jgi:hypothetical protein